MILPPLVLSLRVREPGRRGFRIWLPLLILWPLLLPLALLLLAVCAAVDLILWLGRADFHHFSRLLLLVFRLLAETRGTRVSIRESGAAVVHVVVH